MLDQIVAGMLMGCLLAGVILLVWVVFDAD